MIRWFTEGLRRRLSRTAANVYPPPTESRTGGDAGHIEAGLACIQRGDTRGAEEAFRAAVAINPKDALAWANLGLACKELHRLDESIRCLATALEIEPSSAVIAANLGSVQVLQQDWIAACISFKRAIELEPNSAPWLSTLGYVLAKLGRWHEGEELCRRALMIRADWPEALVNLSVVLHGQHRSEDALECCRQALCVAPANAAAELMIGLILRERGSPQEAHEHLARSYRLDSTQASTRYTLGTSLLQLGEFEEGFALFESRFDAYPAAYRGPLASKLLANTARRWTGEAVDGIRLLLWAEQGFGDTLMMLRYLPVLSERGARVILACQEELVRVARKVQGNHLIISMDSLDELPDFDLHCPLLSLPHLLGTTTATVPLAGGYLAIDRVRNEAPGQRNRGTDSLRVGLVWAGSPTLKDDKRRSVAPEAFGWLASVPGVTVVSLQHRASEAELRRLGAEVVEALPDAGDFLDTANVIDTLDLVIGVDTAVIHLAGALGKRVWMLDRFGSEWRWGFEGQRSCWYSELRLFRQQRQDGWNEVLESMQRAITQLLAVSRASLPRP